MTGTISLIDQGIRQGSVLSCSSEYLNDDTKAVIMDGRAISSKRKKPVQDSHYLLILSQDCDVANSNDSYIEVLVIKKLKVKDVAVQQQNNRNYKRLQIQINGEYWLLDAELISIIEKEKLLKSDLSLVTNLDENSLSVLIDWRVGRYNRVPFPNDFNNDFLINYIKSEGNLLGEFLENQKNNIIDLYVYVDPKDQENAGQYIVSVTALLYDECLFEDKELIDNTLLEHFSILHETDNKLKMCQIEEKYVPTSLGLSIDTSLKLSDFTFLDAQHMRRINLDYLCYDDFED